MTANRGVLGKNRAIISPSDTPKSLKAVASLSINSTSFLYVILKPSKIKAVSLDILLLSLLNPHPLLYKMLKEDKLGKSVEKDSINIKIKEGFHA